MIEIDRNEIKIHGLKVLYAMNYNREFEAFELSYTEDYDELLAQFDEMIEKNPDCVVKHAVVFNEYNPKELQI